MSASAPETVSVLMTDLVGSTAMADRRRATPRAGRGPRNGRGCRVVAGGD